MLNQVTIPTSPSPLLAGLNDEQREAVLHYRGPLLVLAGAGSGKTRTLTVRLAYLVRERGVDPSSILAVTFTNKAADEMRQRITALLGQNVGGMWLGTFHSFGAWLLRQYAMRLGLSTRFTILDTDDSLKAIKRVMERLGIKPQDIDPKDVRAQISKAKNGLLDADAVADRAKLLNDRYYYDVARIYAAYQQELREQNALDFDDLLVFPVELFEKNTDILERVQRRFQFITIDEYQDTNRAQLELTKLLASAHGNLVVVGDPDQSIYAFRGADITNILDFERAFPGARTIRLERNYRSTGFILDAANAVIENNTARKEKVLRPTREPGEKIKVVAVPTDFDEAQWLVHQVERELAEGRSLSDLTVLYRTNAQSRLLEEALRRQGIPYQIVGGLTFYERREVKDVLAYLHLIANPADRGAFERCVNYPRRGIGQSSQDRLFVWAREQGLPILEAAARADEAGVPARAANALREFAAMIQRFAARASVVPVWKLVDEVVTTSGIRAALEAEGQEGRDRLENVDALVASAMEFDPQEVAETLGEAADNLTDLDLFLQRVALITDIDQHDQRAERITLMTIHAAKGLEFPVVFLCGLEDGLFPHHASLSDPDGLEEERRLFYVGMTRAQEKLFLVHAAQRRMGGNVSPSSPSQFLHEIPRYLIEEIRPHRTSSFRLQPDPFRRAPAGYSPFIDDFDSQDVPHFVQGEEVIHPQFGPGTIVQLQGFGQNLRVVVDFGENGRRTLMARSAGLRRGFS